MFLTVLLFYIVNIRVDIQEAGFLEQDEHVSVEWLQPETLNEKFPTHIGKHTWSFDYAEFERVLWRSSLQFSEKFTIDSDTLTLLEQLSVLLPEFLNEEDIERLKFLTKKSLPQSNSLNLTKLVISYRRYEESYLAYQADIKQAKGQSKYELIKASQKVNKKLQVQFFGEVIAKKLFEKKNKVVNYLTQRQLINLDETLTQTQKTQQLLELKKKYQEHSLP